MEYHQRHRTTDDIRTSSSVPLGSNEPAQGTQLRVGVRHALNANDDVQPLIVDASVGFQACE